MRYPTANRDHAAILTFVDSCIRTSECYAFRIGDFDPECGKVETCKRIEGGTKGGKGKVVYLGKTDRNAFWRYLAEREDGEE